MTNFIYDNVALPSDKLDSGGSSAPLASPTRQWSANDANRVFAALNDTRTAIGDLHANVKSFGAKGDGVTDDTAAIQAALDAAAGKSAVVYVTSGVHSISDTLFVPNKVVLSGIGRDDLGKLMASASFPTDGRPMVRLGRAVDTLVFGCRVERLLIDGNSRAKICVMSTAANEQSGIGNVCAIGFTQYGLHFNGASIFSIEDVEVAPAVGGATSGIYLQNCAGDNLVKRATIGVSDLLTNGLHVQATQCIAMSIHVENCTIGVNIDNASCVIIGLSGPTVTPNVPDLIVEQNNTRYSLALNVVKNSATRIVTANFGGYTNADPFMPIWIGGDSIIGGATHEPREIAPAQITTNQNDYNTFAFSSAQVLYLTSDAARDITGFVAGNKGRRLWVYNGGSFNLTLKHQNAGSAATNRIIGRGNADTVLTPGTAAQIYYSPSQSRWLILGDTL